MEKEPGSSVDTPRLPPSPRTARVHTCLPADQLQLPACAALQQGPLLCMPPGELGVQLGQRCLLLSLQVRLRPLQPCRVHVTQAQAQHLQLQLLQDREVTRVPPRKTTSCHPDEACSVIKP